LRKKPIQPNFYRIKPTHAPVFPPPPAPPPSPIAWVQQATGRASSPPAGFPIFLLFQFRIFVKMIESFPLPSRDPFPSQRRSFNLPSLAPWPPFFTSNSFATLCIRRAFGPLFSPMTNPNVTLTYHDTFRRRETGRTRTDFFSGPPLVFYAGGASQACWCRAFFSLTHSGFDPLCAESFIFTKWSRRKSLSAREFTAQFPPPTWPRVGERAVDQVSHYKLLSPRLP